MQRHVSRALTLCGFEIGTAIPKPQGDIPVLEPTSMVYCTVEASAAESVPKARIRVRRQRVCVGNVQAFPQAVQLPEPFRSIPLDASQQAELTVRAAGWESGWEGDRARDRASKLRRGHPVGAIHGKNLVAPSGSVQRGLWIFYMGVEIRAGR